MKLYISGPVTGQPIEETKKKFAQAAKQVEAFGHTPVQPFDNNLEWNATWEEWMVADIALLFKCDGIYLLKDWKSSSGARIEHFIANERGMEIIEQPKI